MNVFFAKFGLLCAFVVINLIDRVNARYVHYSSILPLSSYQFSEADGYDDPGYGNCKPECSSQIFCEGELLHDIQIARVFQDSKTFVDKRLLYPEDVIINRYRQLKSENNGSLDRQQLKKFIDRNFADDPLDKWTPTDLKTTPSILSQVEDDAFKKWLLSINQIWEDLASKVNDRVRQNPELHSILYMPNGFIKAGGRFQEMYYWDSYWIIRGLLLCDMYVTAKGMIENILWLIKVYGHMPNGSRKYYLQRSQPPLLIQMAATYHSCTKDHQFIRDNLQVFELEFQFWNQNRMVTVVKDGQQYRLARYNATSCSPRPESYYEDYILSTNLTENGAKNKLFTAIKSAAESGWDFSSRHVRGKDQSNEGTLLDLDTQSFVYVDLNCILHANAVVLSEWFRYFGNEVKSLEYKRIADNLQNAIDKVLWNDDVGIWLDYDLITGKSRNYFYPSNLTPLWTGSYPRKLATYVDKVVVYLLTQGIIKADFSPAYYGLPASKLHTSQQWDFPNAWSPLQAIVIQGLERTRHPIAKYIAFKMAQKWIRTTYTGFIEKGFMYEKYSATDLGTTGTGGEYTPQTGFGWTNGFILEIFNTWGQFLRSNSITARRA